MKHSDIIRVARNAVAAINLLSKVQDLSVYVWHFSSGLQKFHSVIQFCKVSLGVTEVSWQGRQAYYLVKEKLQK